MTKPSKQAISRFSEAVIDDLHRIRFNKALTDQEYDQSLINIETFIAIALRVFSKTNISKLQSEFRTVEIAARMAGKPVLDT